MYVAPIHDSFNVSSKIGANRRSSFTLGASNIDVVKLNGNWESPKALGWEEANL